MKMGLNVVFVDCAKIECLEAAITPETKVVEREVAELACLMLLNNFIVAPVVLGVCVKRRGLQWPLWEQLGLTHPCYKPLGDVHGVSLKTFFKSLLLM